MPDIKKCAVCQVPSTLHCSACKLVFYCGKEHQKSDWKKGHKGQCKCYEIARNEVLGRHLRATRDIKMGETILREPPLIYGPKIATFPMCLGCHRYLNTPVTNYYKCKNCAWPLCSPECENSPHHIDECALMKSNKYLATIDYNGAKQLAGKKESSYCVILPLRCILLKKRNPAQYEKFAALEDHLEQRIKTPLYNILRANLLPFIKTVLGLVDWSDDEILRVAARLDTNAFEVRQPMKNLRVRAVYSLASMMSHECVSNTRHTFDSEMNIIFIAQKPIAKGDIICTSYTQPLKSTLIRREHLAQAKCFDCTCNRCKDPTEFNTFIGSILCCKCKVGKIISTNPMDKFAVWRCQLCPHELTAKQISVGDAAMLKEIEALDKTSVKAFEDFLIRYRDTLHEKNTHILQVKYCLIQLYGNAPGYSIKEMSDDALKRKIELCEELLEIADIFDSGFSVFRGNLLLDKQEALFAKGKREFMRGQLTESETQDKFEESMNILKESFEIMKIEPGMIDVLHHRTQLLAADLEMVANQIEDEQKIK